MKDRKSFEHLVEHVLEGGADRAVLIDTDQIVVDDRVGLKCRVPLCAHYNHNLTCPPNTITISEFRNLLKNYNTALLLQVKGTGCEEEDVRQAELKVQNLISELETKALMEGNYFAAGFATRCRLCPECVGVQSGEPCRHPFRARPSLDAAGVDIFSTSKNAGIPFNPLDRDELYFAGLLLLF